MPDNGTVTGTVVISGGGTGIGLAVARRCRADGSPVVLLGRRETVLAQAARRLNEESPEGPEVHYAPGDLADPAEVSRISDETIGPLGPVAAVICNAGGALAPPSDNLAGTAQHWRDTLDINVLSAVLLTTAVMPMLARPGGRVLAISSIAAIRGGGGPYGASKAALHAWIFELAEQVGPQGITANVIAPGVIEDTEFFGEVPDPGLRQRLIDETVLNKPGRPEDIAGAVAYFLGVDGGHVTAQIHHVNGGALPGR